MVMKVRMQRQKCTITNTVSTPELEVVMVMVDTVQLMLS